jgi:hypothetical protein
MVERITSACLGLLSDYRRTSGGGTAALLGKPDEEAGGGELGEEAAGTCARALRGNVTNSYGLFMT